jgi:hypothetical protein
VVFRLHPFGRAGITAVALTGVSFGVVALAIRTALGGNWASLAVAVVAGSVLMAAGLLRLRGVLKLRGVARLPRLRALRPGSR